MSEPMPVVETVELTKHFGGFVALNGLDLTIERGSIYGFIGPNGAGKTTTMRILSTLLLPTAGEAWVSGYPVVQEPQEVRRRIGYMPDFFGVYDNMKVWEYLDFFAASYGIAPEKRRGMIDDLLALVDLPVKRESFVDDLSRGMKQRLCLARTLVHDPDLLILDEPASGLDPRARIELRELLLELQRMGKTILVSSHILTELAEMCTHIAIIERGDLLVSGSVADILRAMRPSREIVVRVLGEGARARALVEGMPGVLSAILEESVQAAPVEVAVPESANGAEPEETAEQDTPAVIHLRVDGNEAVLSAILGELVGRGIPVYAFEERTGDLEDVFLHTTQGLVQ
jgi:ABC-2 type transport system ATP-binding protein